MADAPDIRELLQRMKEDAERTVGYPRHEPLYVSPRRLATIRAAAADPAHPEHRFCRDLLALFDCGDGVDYSKPAEAARG